MIRICGTINHDWLEDEREGNMKMKHKKTRLGCRGFTMVELIVVVAILAILLAFAVPHMTGYIKAAHYTTAHAEAKLAADAVQRYLTDEHEKGTLNGKTIHNLMGVALDSPNSPLKDYITGGQKGAVIRSVRADASEGRLNNIIDDTEYSEKAVLVTYDKDGNVTLEDVSKDFDWSNQ